MYRRRIGPWILGRAYGGATWAWNTVGNRVRPRTIVDVWVREKGSTASQAGVLTLVMPYALVHAPWRAQLRTLSRRLPQGLPQPTGATVTFTATSGICSQPLYEFCVQATGGPWILGQAYGRNAIYVWRTTGDAKTTYNVDVCPL